jgi:phospholipid/cholesterol/gamma-HCH transport system permease protein
MPVLVFYADLLGIFGGYIVGATKFAIPAGLYFRMTTDALTLKDIVGGLLKSISFGGIIAVISCYEGFRPFSSIDVSEAVTKAVVRSFILIIMCDCFLTAIFYFV